MTTDRAAGLREAVDLCNAQAGQKGNSALYVYACQDCVDAILARAEAVEKGQQADPLGWYAKLETGETVTNAK